MKLLLATHNQGKVKELQKALVDFEVVSAADYDLPEPVEDGLTFEDNALLKAQAAFKATGLPTLSDDSGFCVNALNDAPGIFSARWAGEGKDFSKAMELVHSRHKLLQTDNMAAHFVCVLAYIDENGVEQVFRGEAHGHITWPPRGDHGFGYDPMFIPDGYDKTFAQMLADEKAELSHRNKALKKLFAALLVK